MGQIFYRSLDPSKNGVKELIQHLILHQDWLPLVHHEVEKFGTPRDLKRFSKFRQSVTRDLITVLSIEQLKEQEHMKRERREAAKKILFIR